MTSGEAGIWVVDRVEGRTLVMVDDAGGRTVEVDRDAVVRAGGGAAEARRVREGTVLRVPLTPEGEPSWAEAVVDEALRQARLEEAEQVLDELKRRDPGGDVVL